MILVKVPVLMEKQIALRLPVIPGGGLTVEDVTLSMSFDKITVTGSPAVVSKMSDVIELPPIDLGQIIEGFENREYTFTLPEGVKSREGNTVEVSLTLPKRDFRLISVPKTQFEAAGLDPQYPPTYVAPAPLVTLQGQSATLSRIEPTDIRVIVELNGATNSGYYSAQIVVDNAQGVGAIEDPNAPYEVYVELVPANQEG
jgi:YbbR domain-containing protein